MNKIHTFFFTVFFLSLTGMAQVSPDCVNAIPICNNTPVNGGTAGYGADDFNGSQTSGCLERALEGTIESNSAWYRFRTGASGQLGFNIAINTDEDWDFASTKVMIVTTWENLFVAIFLTIKMRMPLLALVKTLRVTI